MKTKDTSNKASSIHDYINTHNSATSDFRTTSLSGVRDDLRKHPDYQTLFAETEAASSVDHDSSILSPAAYFVDLMRLVKGKNTRGNIIIGPVRKISSLKNVGPPCRKSNSTQRTPPPKRLTWRSRMKLLIRNAVAADAVWCETHNSLLRSMVVCCRIDPPYCCK
jgi:hypothetical protein